MQFEALQYPTSKLRKQLQTKNLKINVMTWNPFIFDISKQKLKR